MRLFQRLWRDERGAVLSSEMVMVGTLGVAGATAGYRAVSDSVDFEFRDFARSIRSLDQSYSYEGVTGCGAWTAGSSFRQTAVEQSLREIDERIRIEEERLEILRREQFERLREADEGRGWRDDDRDDYRRRDDDDDRHRDDGKAHRDDDDDHKPDHPAPKSNRDDDDDRRPEMRKPEPKKPEMKKPEPRKPTEPERKPGPPKKPVRKPNPKEVEL